MGAEILEVTEGVRYQLTGTTKIYTITTTNVISNPTSPTATAYDESVNADVTSTIMPSGSNSVTGDVITLKPVTALTADHSYRVVVRWVVGSQTFGNYFRIKCPF